MFVTNVTSGFITVTFTPPLKEILITLQGVVLGLGCEMTFDDA